MKLSIIIPCYNSERYIVRCLQSILTQKYKNIEVLVVDDGSVDNTETMVREIMSSDTRVSYFKKENSGVSDTRNVGMQNATGDLITFVDSDDEVCPEMYESLIHIMKLEMVDIVHCSYKKIGVNSKYVGNTQQLHIHNHVEGMEHLLKGDLFTGSPCNKIYKKEVIETIRFDSRFKINEDVLFNYYAFRNATKSAYKDSCFYNYYTEEASACNSTSRLKTARDGYCVNEIMKEESSGTEYEDIAALRFFNSKLILCRVYKAYGKKEDKEKVETLKRLIKKDLKELNLSKKKKLVSILTVYFAGLYTFLYYHIYDKIRTPNWDV